MCGTESFHFCPWWIEIKSLGNQSWIFYHVSPWWPKNEKHAECKLWTNPCRLLPPPNLCQISHRPSLLSFSSWQNWICIGTGNNQQVPPINYILHVSHYIHTKRTLLFSCGWFTALAPMYVSEIAPVNIRGAMGTINQLSVTGGILVSMVLGLSEVLGTDKGWPILLALSAVPALVQLALLPLMPESPSFLISVKKDVDSGKKALER